MQVKVFFYPSLELVSARQLAVRMQAGMWLLSSLWLRQSWFVLVIQLNFFYLKARDSVLLSAHPLPDMPAMTGPGPDQAKAGSWKLNPGVSHGWQGPSDFSHHLLGARVRVSGSWSWPLPRGMWAS